MATAEQAKRPTRLGRNIERLRKAKGLTQEELADRILVTKGHVSRIEAGYSRPSLERLEMLARALGVKQSALLEA